MWVTQSEQLFDCWREGLDHDVGSRDNFWSTIPTQVVLNWNYVIGGN